MSWRNESRPVCIVIAGPNGAGKTTFAREFLPREDVLRRFERGWWNFLTEYRHLADSWTVYDNSASKLMLMEVGP